MDKRYKLTQEDVNQMRELRAEGWTYQSIADKFDVAYSTAQYWTNEEQRVKARIKNAKRRKTGKELEMSIKRDIEKRKYLLRTNKNIKLRTAIQSALDEKRCTRHSVLGIEIKEARKLLKSGTLSTPNAKIK